MVLLISEALSVNDWGASFLIFGFSDPHGLESWERWQNRATNPDQEFSFLRSNYLNLHGGRSQSSDLFAESFWDAGEHSCSTAHNDVTIQIFSDVNVALQNRLIGNLVEAGHLFTDWHWLEKSLWASESLTGNGNSLSVRKFVNFIVLVWIGIT